MENIMESRVLRECTPFFIAKDKSGYSVFSHKLIIKNGKLFALDTFEHKDVQVKSATTKYSIILLDGDGILKQFSQKHMKCFSCSVVNGVYTMDDAMHDVTKYNL